MNEIYRYYTNLAKRDRYLGDEWFINKSKELEPFWLTYDRQDELLALCNGRQDIANFLAYFLQTPSPHSLSDKLDIERWFRRPFALTYDQTPYEAVRQQGPALVELCFTLQQQIEPPYRPRICFIPTSDEVFNEQELSLAKRLEAFSTSEGIDPDDIYIGRRGGGTGYEQTHVVFNKYWEVWFAERGQITLVAWYEHEDEVLAHILGLLRTA